MPSTNEPTQPKGLRVNLYRHCGQAGSLGHFHDVDTVTVLNMSGPFAPSSDAPAALVVEHPTMKGHYYLEPAEVAEDGSVTRMPGQWARGFSLASTSDSRFAIKNGPRVTALAVHDHAMHLETRSYD